MIGLVSPLSSDARAALVAFAVLSVAFAVKHYVADFLLQTSWMARGKERARSWVAALSLHAGCHGGLALLIVLSVAPRLWWLALVDFVIHFGVDRGKATIAATTHWQPNQPQFWWLLGFDQLLHQLTNIGLAVAILLA